MAYEEGLTLGKKRSVSVIIELKANTIGTNFAYMEDMVIAMGGN